MRYFLLNYPALVIALVSIGGSIAIVLAATWITRRRFPERVHTANNEVAGFIFAAVAVIYGVLLAFVVVVVWQSYDHAHTIVEQEANAVIDAYRFSWELPPPYDHELRSAVKTYTTSLIQDDWPAMKSSNGSPASEQKLEALWDIHRELSTAEATTGGPPENLFATLANIENQRRLRLNENFVELPGMLWALLLIGALLTMSFTLFFRSPNARAHYLMVALMTGIIAFVLFLIMELDDPFIGDITITPHPLMHALTTIEHIKTE